MFSNIGRGPQVKKAVSTVNHSAKVFASKRFNSTSPHAPTPKFPQLKESDKFPDGTPDYVKLILTSKVYDFMDETPLTHAVSLSSKLNTNVYLKREDMTPVFSFKLRGASNMIGNLSDEQKKKGIVACSAGNHAQGVAYSANKLGIESTIVMPLATPEIKFKNVRRLGSNVVLYGDDFDAAKSECKRLELQEGYTNIPPFDHPYVIAGQGTIAMELLRQISGSKINAVFCAIGGGGLIAGVAAYLKRIAPHIKVIGVETYDAPAMHGSLKNGEIKTLDKVGSFADGTAVKVVGTETFRVCSKYVDETVLVNTDEISAAIKDVFEDTRAIVEPSGAMTVAGIKKYISAHSEIDHSKNSYISVLSGANMNFDRLRFVAERAVLGEGREVFMLVAIPDVPGSFLKLQNVIHPRSVTEFSYRYSLKISQGGEVKTNNAYIYTSFRVNSRELEVEEVINKLSALGFEAVDISDNEIAKNHGRYLVGGNADLPNERLLSFTFPEKPGALTTFLTHMKNQWNLTLFHYRNHGQDVGKVLVGLDVPPQDEEKLEKFLEDLKYDYQNVTDNYVLQKFLK
ncbi:threonine ammonia-lyase [Saccharomycopsis crataegensis]|uniref:Threonine dehydratase n=1 Tax=Saccharomycopsis crataegensis TaxID=43959 RepID=A0AAV5QR43_9ASCO|nr:threonine ammonia-lyase [Saccharomycopsis crataegensis]